MACEEWVPDVSCYGDWWSGVPEDMQAAAVAWAQGVLWAATGRRYGRCEVVAELCRRLTAPTYQTYPVLGEGGPGGSGDGLMQPYLLNGNWYNCACGSPCACRRDRVSLDGPVDSVTAVTIGGTAVDPDHYRVGGDRWLLRTDGGTWPWDEQFTVTYQRGIEPPPMLLVAMGELVHEYVLACQGSDDCALPSRVQSVVRQGVEITMLESGDYLDKGLTGLPSVDQVIRTLNPSALQEEPRAFSLDAPEQW
jgi:hypothetical protein